jgi:hypothetical protein
MSFWRSVGRLRAIGRVWLRSNILMLRSRFGDLV